MDWEQHAARCYSVIPLQPGVQILRIPPRPSKEIYERKRGFFTQPGVKLLRRELVKMSNSVMPVPLTTTVPAPYPNPLHFC